MRLRSLLRLPSPGYPSDVTTGDPEFDKFLSAVEEGMHGAVSIRRPYLVELADHLVARKRHLLDQGVAPIDATKQVLLEAGDPKQSAGYQRRARLRLFVTCTLVGWLGLGVSCGLVLRVVAWPNPLPFWLMNVLPLGLLMGHFFGYLAGAPSPCAPLAGGNEGRLTVVPSGATKLAGEVLLLGLLVVAMLLAMAAGGIGPLAGTPIGAVLLLVGLASVLLPTALSALATFEIDPDGITYKGWFRSTRIRWQQLQDAQASRAWASVLRPPIGTKLRLAWLDDAGVGHQRVVLLDGGMVNADRLLALLDARSMPESVRRPEGLGHT